MSEFLRWKNTNLIDNDLNVELNKLSEEEAYDAFYKDLEFGTGGLRGVIGAGTNRMNVYTVAKATQGIANYLHKTTDNLKVAISYDSRIKSDLFAKVVVSVFKNNGIETFIYKELMPTPCLSFAVRELKCACGVMITASHNPSKYNGYKVYKEDGCQITSTAADMIYSEIQNIDCLNVKFALDAELNYIPDSVYDEFTKHVLNESVLYGENVRKDFPIIYTPLNGTGLKPVARTLKEAGFTNVIVVEEQRNPDGNFPTCPYPNPEIKEALVVGIEYLKKFNADLLLATDPDCDRVGIAIKQNGEVVLLTGNEVGLLMLDFIASQRIKNNKMPKNPLLVKTIVSTDMADLIAAKYNIRVSNVLTGFKYIGEQIALYPNDYILGFEESYGYLTGTYARDKDAVDGSLMICEMYAYYKQQGLSLLDRLNQLYEEYGKFKNSLKSYQFEGENGMKTMLSIMNKLRGNIATLGGLKVIKKNDYSEGLDNLPKSNVIKFMLENNCSLVARPSGTEPKLKIYFSVKGTNDEECNTLIEKLMVDIEKYIK